MNIRYHVELSEAERCELTALVGGGKHYARKIKRAQILLAADSGLSDDDMAAAVAVGGSTVYRTKRRFVEGNLEAALNEEPRTGADRKLTSNEEALLIATACSSPPEGRARWTLESTGCSPPTRPEPKWRAPIPIPRSKSHGSLCRGTRRMAAFPHCGAHGRDRYDRSTSIRDIAQTSPLRTRLCENVGWVRNLMD